jgi:hypothetical protein
MFDLKIWPPSYEAVGVGAPTAEVKGITAAIRSPPIEESTSLLGRMIAGQQGPRFYAPGAWAT